MNKLRTDLRALSVAAFSLLFAYVLSFLFEGQALYGALGGAGLEPSRYLLTAIVAHFLGQFTCGFFCKSPGSAKTAALVGMGACALLTTPFFFSASPFVWLGALALAGYASGCAIAAWGYFLKEYTPKNERIKSCADMLVYSNILMIVANVASAYISPKAGLALALAFLAAGVTLTCFLPTDGGGWQTAQAEPKPALSIRRPMGVLFLFVAVITVNSGLMYQVINPAFEHLSPLVSWYWATPYIAALLVMRNLPVKAKRPVFLFVAMGMIMCAFLAFMLLARGAADYLIVDTLMLGGAAYSTSFGGALSARRSTMRATPSRFSESAFRPTFSACFSATL